MEGQEVPVERQTDNVSNEQKEDDLKEWHYNDWYEVFRYAHSSLGEHANG